MVLYFETHGTSRDNEAGLASGQYDSPLSEAGKQQAKALGQRYSQILLTRIYCSDLQRSYATAGIAFAGPIVKSSLLRECDYGELSRHPVKVVESVRIQYLTQPFPGGESYEQAVERVARFLDELSGDDAVLVIGHRATYYAFEYLIRRRTLIELVTEPWRWQPGWRYEITRSL